MNEDEAVALYEDIHGNYEFLVDGIHEEDGVYTFEVWDRILTRHTWLPTAKSGRPSSVRTDTLSTRCGSSLPSKKSHMRKRTSSSITLSDGSKMSVQAAFVADKLHLQRTLVYNHFTGRRMTSCNC